MRRNPEQSRQVADENTLSPILVRPFLALERHVDVVALVALAISLFNLVVASVWFLRGAEPELILPKSVTVIGHAYGGESRRYVWLANDMIYVNHGAEGRDVIVKNAKIELCVPEGGNCPRYWASLDWAYFEESIIDGKVKYRKDIKFAHPLPVPGKGVRSGYTVFAPYSSPNYVPVKKLVDKLRVRWTKRNNMQHPRETGSNDKEVPVPLRLRYVVEFFGHERVLKECEMKIYREDIDRLMDPERRIVLYGAQRQRDVGRRSGPAPPMWQELSGSRGWFSRPCVPVEPGHLVGRGRDRARSL